MGKIDFQAVGVDRFDDFRILNQVEKSHLREEGLPIIIEAVLKEHGIKSSSYLSFTILAQQRCKDYDWATLLPTFRHGKVLHPKNKDLLVEILKVGFSCWLVPFLRRFADVLMCRMLHTQILD